MSKMIGDTAKEVMSHFDKATSERLQAAIEEIASILDIEFDQADFDAFFAVIKEVAF
jgi:hypothetical protein